MVAASSNAKLNSAMMSFRCWTGYCAATLVGTLPGEILINRNCTGEEFVGIFIHEFGHAMGFYHVSDRNAVMASGGVRW